MNPIVTVRWYINLSLIAWLCSTSEQTLCSPSLQALVALITLQVYRPPFITSKYRLALLHSNTTGPQRNSWRNWRNYWYYFFPLVVQLCLYVMGDLTIKISLGFMQLTTPPDLQTSCPPVSEVDSQWLFPSSQKKPYMSYPLHWQNKMYNVWCCCWHVFAVVCLCERTQHILPPNSSHMYAWSTPLGVTYEHPGYPLASFLDVYGSAEKFSNNKYATSG